MITLLSISIFLKALFAVSASTLPPTDRQATEGKKIFSLEEVIPLRPEFYPDRLSAQWISETEYVYSQPHHGIVKFNVDARESTTLVPDKTLTGELGNYAVASISKDGKYLLLTSNRQKVYRYSSIAEYYIYEVDNKKLHNISQGLLQTVQQGSGKSVAYVANNNVYYVPDVTKPEEITTLTNEGLPGEVYFGVPDWIYEEEIFNAPDALWFSPSGSHLAVAYFNDTKVESTVYPYYGNPLDLNNQYPHIVGFKYPKAGRSNPVVGLRVYKVVDPTSDAWNIPAPIDMVGEDHILARVNWASDNNLIVVWLNRRQNIGITINCDLARDKCTIAMERIEQDGWIDVNPPLFNDNGTMMLEISSTTIGANRFAHVTRLNFMTFFREDMSPMNGTVTEILGWNSEKDIIYYIASPRHQPWRRQLWTSRNRGTTLKCITCDVNFPCTHATGTFSPKATHGLITCSSTNVPPKTYLFYADTETFEEKQNNQALQDKLAKYDLPMVMFNKLFLEDFVEAHVKLIFPPNMDHNKKYPMIVRVYAGPGTTRVKDTFDLEYYSSYLASNRSYIVAYIDVRGSGCMGLENLFAINEALGTVEVTDTLAAIKKLTETYRFIDPKKIGVWGWSYGGYATTMMLIKDSKNVLACGAAVAPVTSWLFYDSIYTERYMDTPQDNQRGYQRADLMAVYEKLRGRKYLLVHGTGDDNVHYQHSLQLAKQLQHADIAFEQMSYTDENHSLMGVSRHFYHTLDHFWTDCFRD